MKILFLAKGELDETADAMVREHSKEHEVTVIDLRQDKDYGKIVGLIAGSDKVISW